jgi:hypothetical protein
MKAVACACGGALHGAASCTLRVPPAWGRSSCGGLRFGKHVYHTESTLDLDDGFDMRVIVPFRFDDEVDGRFIFIALSLSLEGPIV